MYIPVSRKQTLVVSVALVIGGVFFCTLLLLKSLTTWAEQDLGAFPFKQEDWLRYVLPSQFTQHGRDSIMLTGPSTVRENLLYEQFTDAFPDYSIIQGGISLGTIDDVNIALKYVEKVYGRDALPAILVMGISPRFIANIPDKRPFNDGIDRYSPYFRIAQKNNGFELVEKSPWEGQLARLRFNYWKEPERIRVALLAVLNFMLSGDKINTGTGEQSYLLEMSNRLFRFSAVRQAAAGTRFERVMDHDFSEVLAWLISPYKYRLDQSPEPDALVAWASDPGSWWQQVYTWDPQANTMADLSGLVHFMEFVDTHGIKLLVVNLPERDISRGMFDSENYEKYLYIVMDIVGEENFVDLREFLTSDEFFDLEHSVYPGSLRLTNEVIDILKESKRNG